MSDVYGSIKLFELHQLHSCIQTHTLGFEKQSRQVSHWVVVVPSQRVYLVPDEFCCNIASIQPLVVVGPHNWSHVGHPDFHHNVDVFFVLPLPVGEDCAVERKTPTFLSHRARIITCH